ncbi:hypothetical protein B0H16DRAFT_1463255 [Mycena metata]|uniref:Uncharacterized protein n=1 Tax=Mycena metata TaxID=1033252 RepID=A0AAD7N3U6_9AGAR|nr:hypothetical protein B0H16DRAFT_1463255 [Mycena metata]
MLFFSTGPPLLSAFELCATLDITAAPFLELPTCGVKWHGGIPLFRPIASAPAFFAPFSIDATESLRDGYSILKNAMSLLEGAHLRGFSLGFSIWFRPTLAHNHVCLSASSHAASGVGAEAPSRVSRANSRVSAPFLAVEASPEKRSPLFRPTSGRWDKRYAFFGGSIDEALDKISALRGQTMEIFSFAVQFKISECFLIWVNRPKVLIIG